MMTRREAIIGGSSVTLTVAVSAKAGPVAVCNPPPTGPYSGAKALSQAQLALGQNTMYAMGLCIYPAKSWSHANDCSGLILWCFGLTRNQFKLGATGSTNAIYGDILSGKGLFVQTREPRVGGIIIYPNFTLPGGMEDSGHVGLIKSVKLKDQCGKDPLWSASDAGGVEERYPLELFDCSSTSYWTYGDAVRLGDYTKFLLHDELMVMAAKAGAALEDSRRPVYAVIRGEEKLPFVTPLKLGHCPGR